jgi:hypothetical protein
MVYRKYRYKFDINKNMSYNYQTQRKELFTEDGQVMFIKIRDKANALLSVAGSFRMDAVMNISGDTWTMLACVDRMIELGELREITNNDVAGQHRVFTR